MLSVVHLEQNTVPIKLCTKLDNVVFKFVGYKLP